MAAFSLCPPWPLRTLNISLSFYKDTGPIGEGPTLRNSLNIKHLLRDPASSAATLGEWGVGTLAYGFEGDATKFMTTRQRLLPFQLSRIRAAETQWDAAPYGRVVSLRKCFVQDGEVIQMCGREAPAPEGEDLGCWALTSLLS